MIDDRQALLNVARLGHGNNAAIFANVEDTVGLEDGTKHILDDDRGCGIRDKARLLMKLLGEEIDSEVAMLTGLGRGRDTDDLAWTALQNQQVAIANMMAGDRDGVAGMMTAAAFDIADSLTLAISNACRATLTALAFDDHFLTVMLVTGVERVEDTVSSMLKSVAEGVVVAFVVMITHSVVVLFAGSGTFVFDVEGGLVSMLAMLVPCHVNIPFATIDFDFDFGISMVMTRISVAEITVVSTTRRSVCLKACGRLTVLVRYLRGQHDLLGGVRWIECLLCRFRYGADGVHALLGPRRY